MHTPTDSKNTTHSTQEPTKNMNIYIYIYIYTNKPPQKEPVSHCLEGISVSLFWKVNIAIVYG